MDIIITIFILLFVHSSAYYETCFWKNDQTYHSCPRDAMSLGNRVCTIEGHPETPRTSQHYRIEGKGPLIVPPYAERRESPAQPM